MIGSTRLSLVATLFVSLIFCSESFALRIATYNIRNFDYDTRSQTPTDKSELAKIIGDLDADLIAVQEITKANEFKQFVAKYFPDHAVALTKCGGAHGQLLGFVYNQYKVNLLKFDEDDRVTMVGKKDNEVCPSGGSRPLAIGKFRDMEGNMGIFNALSVHLKSGGAEKNQEKRKEQYELIVEKIDELRAKGEKGFLIMGDFNTTEYSAGGKGRLHFLETFAQAGLEDLGKESVQCSNYYFNRQGGNQGKGQLTASILDHILVDSQMRKTLEVKEATSQAHCQELSCRSARAEDLGLSYQGVSDHCPLLTEIK